MKINDVRELWQHISPLYCVEVGSRGGAFEDLDDVKSQVVYYGFEADKNECERLNAKSKASTRFIRETYFPVAIGCEEGASRLYLTSQPGCSSFFKPNYEYIKKYSREKWYEVVAEADVAVKPLQSFLDSKEIEDIDFLKIDVEGKELDVLKSASDFVDKSLLGVRLEVNYIQHRHGQPSFIETIGYLYERGFRPFQFLENHSWRTDNNASDIYPSSGEIFYSNGQLAHGDLLMLKTDEFIDNSTDQGIEKLLKLSMICYSYGFYSHAQSLISSEQVKVYLKNKYGIELASSAFKKQSKRYFYLNLWESLVRKFAQMKTLIKLQMPG